RIAHTDGELRVGVEREGDLLPDARRCAELYGAVRVRVREGDELSDRTGKLGGAASIEAATQIIDRVGRRLGTEHRIDQWRHASEPWSLRIADVFGGVTEVLRRPNLKVRQ